MTDTPRTPDELRALIETGDWVDSDAKRLALDLADLWAAVAELERYEPTSDHYTGGQSAYSQARWVKAKKIKEALNRLAGRES